MVYAKGPGLYSEIGKRARDLLYRDYQSDQKFSITSYTANVEAINSIWRFMAESQKPAICPCHCGNMAEYGGYGGIWPIMADNGLPKNRYALPPLRHGEFLITLSGAKKDDSFLADVIIQLKDENMTSEVKVDTNSNVYTTVTVDEPAPGVRAIFSSVVLDKKSSKVELQYLHKHVGISTSIGLTARPIVNFSGVVGNQTTAFGTDISFDTATGNFTKCNAGFSLATTDLIASLILNDKADKVTASYFHTVSPLSNTSVGAEITHSFSTNENSLTIGTHHCLDPLTTVKARVDNYGKASALVQYKWRPRSRVTISGEVDTKAIEKSAKVRLGIALKL